MKFDIKNRYNDQILYSGEGETLASVVAQAVSEKADLYGANLDGANLRGADLRGANLDGADLYGANLDGANLDGANLRGADLRGANLYGADLCGANLDGANLDGANLDGANLRGADLYGADLCGANLDGANLDGANLRGADLRGANLGDGFPSHRFRICGEGSIVGWKKLACGNVLRLEIPADAKRVNGLSSRKCRAEYAIVCALYNKEGKQIEPKGELVSRHDSKFTYQIGQEVRPDAFNDDIRQECASGIHFFITFEEAAEY